MEIISYFIAFIIGVFFVLIVFFINTIIKDKKPINKVHFYVARDKDGRLWLHIGKPIRIDTVFGSEVSIDLTYRNFHSLGLNKNDFDNLKWEDEPVEVFLNMKN